MKRMLIAVTLACVISGTALAGEMPIVNRSAVGEMPAVPTTPGETNTPGVESASNSGTDESLGTIVLLALITALLGR